MEKKIKIAMIAANMELNGISAVIMNYCRNINLNDFDITLFVGKDINENFRKELEHLNIKIIELPTRRKSKVQYYRALDKLLEKGKYDIIHVHGNSSIMAIDLLIGWKKKIPIRIAHSHNSKCSNIKVHKLLKPFFYKLYTNAFACSKEAGDWIFKDKKYIIINNGIDVQKYKFDNSVRKNIRHKLHIGENELVLGHIGRINYQKNQDYLLNIFEKYAEKNCNVKLLVVGKGPLYEQFRERAVNSKYSERIILYGESNEPEQFYMAMDIFVFPSRYEGLPVTLVEAQVSGVPCLISDKITDEVIFSDDLIKCSIDSEVDDWINLIETIKFVDRETVYKKNIDKINIFDIKNNVKELEKIYFTLISENRIKKIKNIKNL